MVLIAVAASVGATIFNTIIHPANFVANGRLVDDGTDAEGHDNTVVALRRQPLWEVPSGSRGFTAGVRLRHTLRMQRLRIVRLLADFQAAVGDMAALMPEEEEPSMPPQAASITPIGRRAV